MLCRQDEGKRTSNKLRFPNVIVLWANCSFGKWKLFKIFVEIRLEGMEWNDVDGGWYEKTKIKL